MIEKDYDTVMINNDLWSIEKTPEYAALLLDALEGRRDWSEVTAFVEAYGEIVGHEE